jgi:hypothetical protein
MTRRWWKWLLVVGILVPLLVWGYDRLQMIDWVGRTDLDVEFVVTEAGSSAPVPGARVEVHSDGGFYEEKDPQEFVLITDADGVARKECRGNMCGGRSSGLGFTDTYAVSRPSWRFRVTAPGYEPCEWAALGEGPYRQQAKETGPGHARLEVAVSLQRNRS